MFNKNHDIADLVTGMIYLIEVRTKIRSSLQMDQ